MGVQFITISQNAKTGPVPASIVERASCWPGCALFENGCYAEAGALPGYGAKIDGALLEELVVANAGKNVIAFTTNSCSVMTPLLSRTGA